jgi:hypothetical protein
MVAVHRELLGGLDEVRAVFLDATFGFQENADELCQKAVEYFDVSLRTPLAIASCRKAATQTPAERGRFLEQLAWGTYLFAGPGSPSYGLRQLRDSGAAAVLARRLGEGATVVLASAAAVTAGRYAIPVYEIYKVGADPTWLDGLDLLDAFGITAAVVPHYDNKEGATHDTRFCYIGERRLALLEAALPPGVGILGVDEHTAVILDGARGVCRVRGKGRLVLRVGGVEQALAAPGELSLEELREALSAPTLRSAAPPDEERATLELETVDELATRKGLAAALAYVLDGAHDLEPATAAALARLARHASEGLVDREAALAPLVEALVAEREAARAAKDWALADRLRDLAQRAGVMLEDTPEGTRWRLVEPVHW